MSQHQLQEQLGQIDEEMHSIEDKFRSLLQKIHPQQYRSAVNLLHYLAFRSKDVKLLQQSLHNLGLSSLTNAESHIHSQLLAVLKFFGDVSETDNLNFEAARQILLERSNFLFGNTGESIPAIMVTFKTSHAHDYLMVKKLLKSGMNIARINCAHDDQETWLRMIKNIRTGSESAGTPCKIYMDLAGPKIRTKIKNKKQEIKLDEEDIIYLADEEGFKKKIPIVGCTLPGLAKQVKPNERVLFDDGLIEAKVIDVREGMAELEIIRVSSKKSLLRAGKGINFPDSFFSIPALTDFDRQFLPFILEHADLVGYSFVHYANDISELQLQMQEKKIPVILKIETPEAFNTLPHLLLKAMEQEYYGVMIARGDLAVELGFERIGEAQEEISLLCQAAHAPLIWATQVLENLNKKGMASRSEVTDASYGIMAECVMLNKGSNTVQAIKTLKSILSRSRNHHFKMNYLLRPLKSAIEFTNSTTLHPV